MAEYFVSGLLILDSAKHKHEALKGNDNKPLSWTLSCHNVFHTTNEKLLRAQHLVSRYFVHERAHDPGANSTLAAAAAAKSLQSCPTLCDPIDGSPPGSPVPGILQARTLEWVAISFSNAGK